MAVHWFLFYTSSYFTILVCIPLSTASWLCRSSVSQPLIVFFHILYSPILHQFYLHTLVAQPYGCAEAVQSCEIMTSWQCNGSSDTASLLCNLLVPLVAKFPHLCLFKEALLQLFPPSSPDSGTRLTIVPYCL